MATGFKHLHYGTWNSLDDKGNTIDDLGIGFVTATSDGMGMTGRRYAERGQSRPTRATGSPACGQADNEGDGKISDQMGKSDMTASFEENTDHGRSDGSRQA